MFGILSKLQNTAKKCANTFKLFI